MLPKHLLTTKEKEVLGLIKNIDLFLITDGKNTAIQGGNFSTNYLNFISHKSILFLCDAGYIAPVSNTNTAKTYKLAHPPREGTPNGK